MRTENDQRQQVGCTSKVISWLHVSTARYFWVAMTEIISITLRNRDTRYTGISKNANRNITAAFSTKNQYAWVRRSLHFKRPLLVLECNYALARYIFGPWYLNKFKFEWLRHIVSKNLWVSTFCVVFIWFNYNYDSIIPFDVDGYAIVHTCLHSIPHDSFNFAASHWLAKF